MPRVGRAARSEAGWEAGATALKPSRGGLAGGQAGADRPAGWMKGPCPCGNGMTPPEAAQCHPGPRTQRSSQQQGTVAGRQPLRDEFGPLFERKSLVRKPTLSKQERRAGPTGSRAPRQAQSPQKCRAPGRRRAWRGREASPHSFPAELSAAAALPGTRITPWEPPAPRGSTGPPRGSPRGGRSQEAVARVGQVAPVRGSGTVPYEVAVGTEEETSGVPVRRVSGRSSSRVARDGGAAEAGAPGAGQQSRLGVGVGADHV